MNNDEDMNVNGVCTFSFGQVVSKNIYEWTSGDIIGISLYKSDTNEIHLINER